MEKRAVALLQSNAANFSGKEIFQEKIWLAEETTRERFQKLTVYVELWERGLNRAIPVEVVAWLNVREAGLLPLYEDLEQTFRNLRAKLT